MGLPLPPPPLDGPTDFDKLVPAHAWEAVGGRHGPMDPAGSNMPKPRLGPAELEILGRAEKAQDLGTLRQRILGLAKRDEEGGKLTEEGKKRFEQLRTAKGPKKLQLLRDYANGLLTASEGPQTREVARHTEQEDQETQRGWLNWHELLVHTGGHLDEGQRTWAGKLWRAAAGRGEREHPDGPGLPKQRKFTLASLDIARTRQEHVKEVSIQQDGPAEPDTLQDLLEELLPAAGGGQEAEASARPQQQAPGKKDPSKGGNDPPPTREHLLAALYKGMPKIYQIAQDLPAGSWGDMAHQKLDPLLHRLKATKDKLEDPASVDQQVVTEGKKLLQEALLTANTLHKLSADLRTLQKGQDS